MTNVVEAKMITAENTRNVLSHIIASAPTLLGHSNILKASCLDTQLGPMIAIADEEVLYLLEFVDRRGLQHNVEHFMQKTNSAITLGRTQPISLIESELSQYFDGKLKEFRTPLLLLGSPFQKRVWEELKKIPFGETRSYSHIATAVGKSTAFRAVAQANSANRLAIIVPCHRVINANGKLGGYSAGLTRKQWLINHEKQESE
jgi:AraC family transcriptional regulator, regulatory protein of adaptative response / methylated-DNA-[protein]-cysteine methyltransferase